MVLVDIRVPQLGEGLQEALIIALLKAPGVRVAKDEPVFEMETDKARVEVEAAHAGLLREWLVHEGDVVAIGSVVGRIEVADAERSETPSGVEDSATTERSVAPRSGGGADRPGATVRVPPRTRAYARTLGLSEEELRRIPAPSGKLLPADVDQYMAECKRTTAADAAQTYSERRLSAQQRALTFRFRRSAQLVIPATITYPLAWGGVERALRVVCAAYPDVPVGALEVIAFAVAQGAAAHRNFRSILVSDDQVREYPYVTLGIAVHRPQGDLVTAVVPRADTMPLPEFARAVQSKIASALEGRDQSDDATQIILTYLGESQVTHGVPTLVAPAVATLFVGAAVELAGGVATSTAALCLTFDHRLINGIEAAQFLELVAGEVKKLGATGDSLQTDSAGGGWPRLAGRVSEDVPTRTLGDERVASVETLVLDRVVGLLGAPLGTAELRRPLRSLGVTSVMSVALSKGLEKDLGIPVPATLVWNYPTVEAIVRFLTGTLDARTGSAGASDVAAGEEEKIEGLLEEIERLSDEEASRLLREEGKRGDPRNG